MHGLVESQAVTKAAQELSAARFVQAQGFEGADEVVRVAKAKYHKALQVYTDPFKVKRDWSTLGL